MERQEARVGHVPAPSNCRWADMLKRPSTLPLEANAGSAELQAAGPRNQSENAGLGWP